MKVYSFTNTVVHVNGVEITGWADGDDVIKVSRLADAASHKVGAAGDMVVSLSADKSGQISFTLQQTSGSNKMLNALCDLQEGGAKTFVPVHVMFQDTHRNDTVVGSPGYIKKIPDLNRGANSNNNEWVIVVERLDVLLGNPTLAGIAKSVGAIFG